MTNHSDADRIEADIRNTRAELDHTIDALRDALTPGQIVDQLMPHFREGTVDMSRNFARSVRDNPVPFALMATSLAWLMMSRGRRHDEDWTRYESDRTTGLAAEEYDFLAQHDHVHSSLSNVKQAAGETLEAFNERLYQAKAAALGVRQEVAEDLAAFRHRVDQAFVEVSAKASSARRRLMAQGARLKAGAKNLVHNVEAKGEQAIEKGQHYYEEHPLVVGALGIAAGALIGSLLPSTRIEDRYLGEAGHSLRHRAADAAHAAKDAARDTAKRVVDTAKEAARREGLTLSEAQAVASDVGERAKRVAEDVVQTGREEVESRIPQPAGTPSPASR